MYFSAAALATALAFAQTAFAGPVPAAGADKVAARQDPHELDFRTFGVSGCHDENQGVYTLELSSNNQCLQFVDPIGSLTVADNKCTLTLYADAGCSVSPVVVPTNVCQNGVWQSYKMTC
ncbi:hypothetical protein Sste5346_002083 [Sporothrix stenoceras]|uniref:Uncharacterized protein n=1 Tax=Sporothrix stenoceras TaxID=5173 RepID=A0ABR3ZMF2_9PEZI